MTGRGRIAFLFVAGGALLSASATLAPAAVYHVGPAGSDSYPGTSPDSAWRNIGRANVVARPGDVIYVWPNPSGYAHFPKPDSAGSNPTGGGWITYIAAGYGTDPLLDHDARAFFRIVGGGNVVTPYTSIKGFLVDGTCTLKGTAQRCSLVSTTITGDLLLDGCDYTVVSRCLVLGPRLSVAYAGQDSHVVSCTIEDSRFPRLGIGVSGGNHRFITGRTRTSKCDSLLFQRNRLTTVMTDIADAHPRVHFWTQHSTFRNNYHHITTQQAGREFYALRLRDSTCYNAFVGDTIIMNGPALSIVYWSSEGDNTGPWERSVGNNVVDSCYINLMGSAGSRMLFQQGMYGWTFRHNVMLCHGRPIDAGDVKGKNLIDHNTFVGGPWLGIVNFDKTETEPGFGDTVTFTNNILYSGYAGDTADVVSNYCSFFAHSQAFDSAGVGRLVSDHNLYTYYGWRSAPGDRAHRWDQGNYSPTGPGGLWSQVFGLDAHSVYGSPMFMDSTQSLIFDPRLRPGSPAIGAGTGGSDIGAIAFAGVLDAPPPRAPDPPGTRAWPNPGRGGFQVSYSMRRPGAVRLVVLDVSGRRVRQIREQRGAGEHVMRWDGQTQSGEPTPPGVYFLELRTGEHEAVHRVVRLE